MTANPTYMSVASLVRTMPTTRRMRTTLIHRMVPSLSDVLLWPEASCALLPPVLRDVVIDGRTKKTHQFREDPTALTPRKPEMTVEVEVQVEMAQACVQHAAVQEPEPEPEPQQALRMDKEKTVGENEDHGAEPTVPHGDNLAAATQIRADHGGLTAWRDVDIQQQAATEIAAAEPGQPVRRQQVSPVAASHAEVVYVEGAVEASASDLEGSDPEGAAAAAAGAAPTCEAGRTGPQQASTLAPEVSTLPRQQLEVKFATTLQ